MTKSFEELKQKLICKPILRLPDVNKSFYLQCDASEVGVGAVLCQMYNDELHPVGFASKKLEPRESRYSSIERECLAVVWAVKYFERYLYGKEFTLYSDHNPLTYLDSSKFINNRVLR